MATDVHPEDVIAYPTNRVVGTITDPENARAAIEALLQAGFARHDIDLLHGEEDLHRPDPTGAEHTYLAQFQRTLIRKLGDEYKHLRHYVEDIRAGRNVLMVLAKKRDRREAAADILGAHGAESIEFYGRWSWHSLESHPAPPTDGTIRDPAPGRVYEVHIGESTVRVRMDSESRLTILRKAAGAPDLSRILVTYLKPHLVMITWQEADRTTHVHVYDFETGEVHAVVSYADRRVYREKGTISRLD